MNLSNELIFLETLLNRARLNVIELSDKAVEAISDDPAKASAAANNLEASARRAEESVAAAGRALRSLMREVPSDDHETTGEKPQKPSFTLRSGAESRSGSWLKAKRAETRLNGNRT